MYLKLRRELAWIEKKMKKMEWMKRPFGKEMEESDGGDGQKGEYLKEIEKQSK